MSDLMELVNECEVTKVEMNDKIPLAKENRELLLELGFETAANNLDRKISPIIKKAEIASHGFIEIPRLKIEEFLARKVNAYEGGTFIKKVLNSVMPQVSWAQVSNAYQQIQGLSALYASSVGQMQMVENTIAHRDILLGPAYTQQCVARTKDFTNRKPGTIGKFIWNEEPIKGYAGIPPTNVLLKFKDTLVKKVFDYFTVASVNEVRDPLLLGRIKDSDSRWFIAQWGDDVSLDDVI